MRAFRRFPPYFHPCFVESSPVYSEYSHFQPSFQHFLPQFPRSELYPLCHNSLSTFSKIHPQRQVEIFRNQKRIIFSGLPFFPFCRKIPLNFSTHPITTPEINTYYLILNPAAQQNVFVKNLLRRETGNLKPKGNDPDEDHLPENRSL